MVLLFKCANGVVAWRSVQFRDRTWAMVCNRDKFQVPVSIAADATWESGLTTVLQHSVSLAGAFQDLFVLPDRL